MGATEQTADAWIAAWAAKATEDGLEPGSAYWQAGWDRITEKTRKLPKWWDPVQSRISPADKP